MRKTFLIIATLAATAADARTLRYGNASVELTTEQKTSPALHVQISEDETVFGALYDATEVPAPANSLHIEHDDTEYWVGAWCDWWPHLVNKQADCAPTLKLTNKFLSLDEVNKYITPTDISQWELISACHEWVNSGQACAGGTLQAGIYLFFSRYYQPTVNSYNGYITRMAIFDHPVSYVSIHGPSIYAIRIDTQHEEYETPNLLITSYNGTSVTTNVSDLPDEMDLYVYRLK